ncbi:MAG: hypothetical protein ACM33U_09085 [Solirubrobacterales bacterium]|nr:hypothetical protein [Solirubrobacterales bacterium]
MSLLTRDQILIERERATVDVDVPEWGGTVRVREMSGKERDHWEASVVQVVGRQQRLRLENLRARLVAMTAVDEMGNLLFSEKDVQALGQQSAAALERVFDASRKLSRLSDDDVKELVEGFGNAPNGASTSDSPGTSD